MPEEKTLSSASGIGSCVWQLGVRFPDDLMKNFEDAACRRQLIKQYGDSRAVAVGMNDRGEEVLISVTRTGIVISTYLKSRWIKKGYYNEDGQAVLEEIDGRW